MAGERAPRAGRTALSATSTHDTKRSEDVRARLNVLSELPGAWKQATARWARANRRGRSMVDGQSYPEPERGVPSLPDAARHVAARADDAGRGARSTASRIVAYMQKAMREAKVFTSWLNPSEAHEQAMTRFVETTLAPDNTAVPDRLPRSSSAAWRSYGIYNSLAQLAIKIGAPGVPDFYQGTELLGFQPGRSGQPPARRLRAAADAARRAVTPHVNAGTRRARRASSSKTRTTTG